MAELVETSISNAEIKRVVLKGLRSGQFNITDLEHLFKRVYSEIESRHPSKTQWAYNFVSRKYSAQVSKELREQRKQDRKDLDDLY